MENLKINKYKLWSTWDPLETNIFADYQSLMAIIYKDVTRQEIISILNK